MRREKGPHVRIHLRPGLLFHKHLVPANKTKVKTDISQGQGRNIGHIMKNMNNTTKRQSQILKNLTKTNPRHLMKKIAKNPDHYHHQHLMKKM